MSISLPYNHANGTEPARKCRQFLIQYILEYTFRKEGGGREMTGRQWDCATPPEKDIKLGAYNSVSDRKIYNRSQVHN
jgi:hypothetical protein